MININEKTLCFRHLLFVLALAFIAVLTMSVQSFAYSDDDFEELDFKESAGVTTEITDIKGQLHTFEGLLDVSRLEDCTCVELISSYEVFYDGDSLMSVQLHDILPEEKIEDEGPELSGSSSSAMNGYYSIYFDMDNFPGTTTPGSYQAFVTGLNPDNLAKIQNEVIAARLRYGRFDIESAGFIDAEKKYYYDYTKCTVANPDDGDCMLCWAAAVSNLLHYTGWGEAAHFGSTDSVLEHFTKYFADDGGWERYAMSWFLNGFYPGGMEKVNGGGSFFPDIPSQNVSKYTEVINSESTFIDDLNLLRNGYGCTIGISIPGESSFIAGHALTLWGYVIDKSKSESSADGIYEPSADALCGLFLTDSDMDKTFGENRRAAPDIMTFMDVEPTVVNFNNGKSHSTWKISYISDYVIYTSKTLAPYSESYTRETKGTMDLHTDPDFVCSKLRSYYYNNKTGKRTWSYNYVLDSSTESAIHFTVTNDSYCNIASGTAVTCDYELVNAANQVITKASFTHVIQDEDNDDLFTSPDVTLRGLPEGNYTFRASVNTDNAITESYYANNTMEYTITLVDGDTYGDGESNPDSDSNPGSGSASEPAADNNTDGAPSIEDDESANTAPEQVGGENSGDSDQVNSAAAASIKYVDVLRASPTTVRLSVSAGGIADDFAEISVRYCYKPTSEGTSISQAELTLTSETLKVYNSNANVVKKTFVLDVPADQRLFFQAMLRVRTDEGWQTVTDKIYGYSNNFGTGVLTADKAVTCSGKNKPFQFTFTAPDTGYYKLCTANGSQTQFNDASLNVCGDDGRQITCLEFYKTDFDTSNNIAAQKDLIEGTMLRLMTKGEHLYITVNNGDTGISSVICVYAVDGPAVYTSEGAIDPVTDIYVSASSITDKNVKCFASKAPVSGLYTLTVDGPDGVLYIFDENGTITKEITVIQNGTTDSAVSYTCELNAGETLRYGLRSYISAYYSFDLKASGSINSDIYYNLECFAKEYELTLSTTPGSITSYTAITARVNNMGKMIHALVHRFSGQVTRSITIPKTLLANGGCLKAFFLEPETCKPAAMALNVTWNPSR